MEAFSQAEYVRGLEAALRVEFLKPEYDCDAGEAGAKALEAALSGLALPPVSFSPPARPSTTGPSSPSKQAAPAATASSPTKIRAVGGSGLSSSGSGKSAALPPSAPAIVHATHAVLRQPKYAFGLQSLVAPPPPPTTPPPPASSYPVEPIPAVAAAYTDWSHRLLTAFTSTLDRCGVSLTVPCDADAKPGSYADDPVGPLQAEPLTTDTDLLEVLAGIRGPVPPPTRCLPPAAPDGRLLWGRIQIPLPVPSLHDLRHQFTHLHPSASQMGVDDRSDWVVARWTVVGKLALRSTRTHVQQYARRGCPNTLRSDVWNRLLGCPPSATLETRFASLVADASAVKFAVDDISRHDAQQVCDDHNFFPFFEVLQDVLMAFSRDATVLHRCVVLPATPLVASVEGRGEVTVTCPVPPSGILPFRGMTRYAAPLCYVYSQDHEVYAMLAAMYSRYWCRLSCVSSTRGTILPLCRLFEDLLQAQGPELFSHFVAHGLHPLDFAFPWIRYAFGGFLDIREVLLLWDRVVGFDSLEVLSVVAVGIMLFRKAALMEATTAAGVQELLCDLTKLRVVPLMQYTLFGAHTGGGPAKKAPVEP